MTYIVVEIESWTTTHIKRNSFMIEQEPDPISFGRI